MSTTKTDETVETKTVEETVEIDQTTLDSIVKQTSDALMPQIAKTVADSNKGILDSYISKTEEIEKKSINDKAEDSDDPIEKGIKDGRFTDIAKEGKEMRLFKAARALSAGDLLTLRRYNDYALALRVKANYGNEATTADGAVLVPDPEFDTTVYNNLPKYGVAFADANVRQTDRTQVYALSLDSGLSFYATAEAGVKTGAKLAFSRKLVALQKYAVIVPATDELTDDAAVDFWNLVTQELTRAYARVADEITFTDTTYGITNQTGVITEQVSGAGTTIDWGDLLSAEGKVEDDLDTSNFKWYLRKETFYRLIALRGTTNDHYLTGSLNDGWVANPNIPTTPWGTPIVFTRVLPSSGPTASPSGQNVVGSNDAFAVYGDLKNYLLYQKKGMELKVLTEATVKDAGGSDFNLATQDGTAMRAVIRLLGMLPKGNASKFVILGTGTVS